MKIEYLEFEDGLARILNITILDVSIGLPFNSFKH